MAAPTVGGTITAPLLSMFVIPAAVLLMRRQRVVKADRPAFWRWRVGQLDRFGTAANRAVGAVTGTPEFNVATFALLLNFAWEILQAPLYAGMAGLPHAQVTTACLQATVGDMVIMLLAYGAVAAIARSRRWIMVPSGWQLAWFIAIGVSITAAIEWLATRGYWVGGWNYLPVMPLLPGTGIGLAPLLQWVLLPLLTVWFTRRQLISAQQTATL